MLDSITAFLKKNPDTKARVIAAQLDFDRADVSRVLHSHSDLFQQDAVYQWSLVEKSCRIEFSGRSWLIEKNFEDALKQTSCSVYDASSVVFVLKGDVKPMLDFLSRLLALSNQLVATGTSVTIDFSESRSVLSYLNRVEFFGVLNSRIAVLPKRPSGRVANAHRGKNVGVIEFRAIDPASPENDTPKLLQSSFVSCAGASYSKVAFTMLSELFGNVLEHSGTASPGFACLQFYKGSRKIQVVISDNGLGIVGTLAPVVPRKYPQVHDLMVNSEHPGVALLTEVFKRGSLSMVDSDGRGLGIWRSGDIAEKFRAKISVRQSDFELRVHHNHAGVQFTHRAELAPLQGTHICFEFKLDHESNAA